MQNSFPPHTIWKKFGEARQDLTIKELAEKFLALKETEVAKRHSTRTVPSSKIF